MIVDYGLILAAGKGTRMGEIGKTLPKVLWPIFDKNLLELKFAQLKQTNIIKKYCFNTYNFKDRFIQFYNSSAIQSSLEIVIENDILDIGGAIHNFKKNHSGLLFISNGDQLLLTTKDYIREGLELLRNVDIVLFSFDVAKEDGYNKLVIDQGMLRGIQKNQDVLESKFETYTGMSLINLDNINMFDGESKFFDSVANWNQYRIAVVNVGVCKYWDFGTLDSYIGNLKKILTEKSADVENMKKYLFKLGALSEESFLYHKSNLEQKGRIMLKTSIGETLEISNSTIQLGSIREIIS